MTHMVQLAYHEDPCHANPSLYILKLSRALVFVGRVRVIPDINRAGPSAKLSGAGVEG